MARHPRSPLHRSADGAEIIDLFDYMPTPRRAAARGRGKRVWKPVVTDNLPDRFPVTEAELDFIEVHFADFLDELFGKRF